jgi:hypothetical protein
MQSMEESRKSLKIGTQEINLEELKNSAGEELIKKLETIYFDGYQQGLKSLEKNLLENEKSTNALKGEIKIELNQESSNTIPQIEEKIEIEGKIEINFSGNSEIQDPLQRKMKEITDMVYQFKKPGYVIYRYDGNEYEYIKSKYGFTTLPMKAWVFETEEEANSFKSGWNINFDELFIRKV